MVTRLAKGGAHRGVREIEETRGWARVIKSYRATGSSVMCVKSRLCHARVTEMERKPNVIKHARDSLHHGVSEAIPYESS